MALSRERKEEIVAGLTARLQNAQGIVFTHYRGLDVDEMIDLRAKLRESGATYHVVKNTLLGRIFEAAGLGTPDPELLSGPTAIAVLTDDLSGPTKTLFKVAKDTEILEIRGGYLGTSQLNAAGVEALSKLPSREELLSTLLGTIGAPSRQLVTVIAAPMRDLVGVISARVREGKGQGESEAA